MRDAQIEGFAQNCALILEFVHPTEVDIYSNNVRPYMYHNQKMIAEYLQSQGRLTEAKQTLEHIFSYAPWNSRSLYARLLVQEEQWPEALIQYDIALSRALPIEEFVYATRGKILILRKLKKYPQALETMRGLIKQESYKNHVELVPLGMIVAMEAGDPETAQRWLNKGRDLYPGNPLIEQVAASSHLK